MKNNNNNVHHTKLGLQQRKSSFADPYNETGRRKAGVEREVTKEGRERESAYVFSQQHHPFPQLDTPTAQTKYNNPFKPYETIYNTPATPPGFQARRLVKRDTPKRLPKLEHVSGSLKLKSKTEGVIEFIAEKPQPKSFVAKELPFQINKIEVSTLQSYSKLPNLTSHGTKLTTTHNNSNSNITNINNNNHNSSFTSTTTHTSTQFRRNRADSIKKVHELQQELKKVESSLTSEEAKQQELKQVQDNIQQLQNIHNLTKQSRNKNNNNKNNINTDGIMQNLQDIAQIQHNIHQTQNLLQVLQQTDTLIPKSRNSLEFDESFKLEKLFTTPSVSPPPISQNNNSQQQQTNPAVVLGSYLPRLVFRRFEGEVVDVATRGTFFDYVWGVVLFADISGKISLIFSPFFYIVCFLYVFVCAYLFIRIHCCYQTTAEAWH